MRKSSKQRSKEQERRLAKKFGGEVQPGSGAPVNRKGDIVTDTYLMEAKTTSARQVTLRLDVLEKIEGEAFQARKNPALVITFEPARRDFVVLSMEDFQALMEKEKP